MAVQGRIQSGDDLGLTVAAGKLCLPGRVERLTSKDMDYQFPVLPYEIREAAEDEFASDCVPYHSFSLKTEDQTTRRRQARTSGAFAQYP